MVQLKWMKQDLEDRNYQGLQYLQEKLIEYLGCGAERVIFHYFIISQIENILL
jgi:hypothetical protein